MQAPDNQILDDNRPAEPPHAPVRRTLLNVAFAVTAGLVSIASLVVVIQSANDEPYVSYRRSDAVVQVGVGTALMLLWACWAGALVVLVRARKLPAGWLALLLWAAICLFFLGFSSLGYHADMERFVFPASGVGK